MIESVLVKNFQNHKRKFVKLSPYVNCFWGASGRGKSAFLRAVRWCLTNQPQGKSFVGNWRKAPYAYVRIKLDGTRLARKKGARHNSYHIGSRVYKAFGAGLPQPVADLGNVGPANYQSQIEAPLWFTLSPSEVSRRLNEIINLKAIDRSLQLASIEVRQASAAVKVSRDRLTAARKQCTELQWAVEYSSQVAELAKTYDEWQKLRLRMAKLDTLVQSGIRASQSLQSAKLGLKLAGTAVSVGKSYMSAKADFDRLGSLVAQIERIRTVTTADVPDIGPIQRAYNAALAAKKRSRKLHGLWLAGANLRWERKQLDQQIDETHQQLKRFKGRCPTCGQKLRSV